MSWHWGPTPRGALACSLVTVTTEQTTRSSGAPPPAGQKHRDGRVTALDVGHGAEGPSSAITSHSEQTEVSPGVLRCHSRP